MRGRRAEERRRIERRRTIDRTRRRCILKCAERGRGRGVMIVSGAAVYENAPERATNGAAAAAKCE